MMAQAKQNQGDEYHYLLVDGIKSDTFRAYTGRFYEHIKTKGFKHIGEFNDHVKNHKKKAVFSQLYKTGLYFI